MSIATAVKERPILFSGEMVRAILDGRKTQTRRAVKLPRWAQGRDIEIDEYGMACVFDPSQETHAWIRCPYASINAFGNGGPQYKLGERLWVRETWTDYRERTADEQVALDVVLARQGIDPRPFEDVIKDFPKATGERKFLYRADFDGETAEELGPWKPSIFMPRDACRIYLEITDVRVERLNDISEADATAEAAPEVSCDTHSAIHEHPIDDFRSLWDRINGNGSWAANSWVWAIQFRRIENAG